FNSLHTRLQFTIEIGKEGKISFLDVVELMKTSIIFVKNFALKNVRETCTKQTLMARSLMKLVFTTEALLKCSLKGKCTKESSDFRSALSQKGVNAILGNSDIKLRVTGALLLLPFIFSHAFVEKTWKPTRIDVVESFITRVCSETEIQEHIERRCKSSFVVINKSKKLSNSVQPYILAVGPTWEHIIHAHIIVDKVLYTCETIVEATELCFKLFHAYHSDYPPESKHVWQLIQQGFYKLFIKNHDLNRRTISKALADIGIELDTEKKRSKEVKA
ncbi:hypothetical protein ALC62_07170, partial [Cyphomyrmex costatus]